MEKVKITVCTGTACYILGGANLLVLEDYLPAELKPKVEIVASPCLGFCRSEGFRDANSKPPYVKIGDSIVSSASVQKIVALLQEI